MLATAAQSIFHVGHWARFEVSQGPSAKLLNTSHGISQNKFLAVLSSSAVKERSRVKHVGSNRYLAMTIMLENLFLNLSKRLFRVGGWFIGTCFVHDFLRIVYPREKPGARKLSRLLLLYPTDYDFDLDKTSEDEKCIKPEASTKLNEIKSPVSVLLMPPATAHATRPH